MVYDSALDIEVKWDQLFSMVAVEMPQYSIQDLRAMPIHKFMRLVMQAEEKQRKKTSAARNASAAGSISRAVK